MSFPTCLKFIFILTISLLESSSFVQAQGCSDAGICDINIETDSMSSVFDQDIETLMSSKNRIQLRHFTGIGENGVLILKTDIGGSFQIGQRVEIQGRIPFMYTSGDLGHTSGLADLTLGVKTTIWELDKQKISGGIALKIPTNKSNLSFEKQMLPMPYQISLGTLDLILRGE